MKTSNINMTYNLIQIGLMNQQLAKNISTLMYYEKALNILKGKKHPQKSHNILSKIFIIVAFIQYLLNAFQETYNYNLKNN